MSTMASDFRYWLHERESILPCAMKCGNEHYRILTVTSNLPVSFFLERSKPLSAEHANCLLIDDDLNDDLGRIRILAGEVERAAWTLWPDATHVSVGGGTVHVFMEGSVVLPYHYANHPPWVLRTKRLNA